MAQRTPDTALADYLPIGMVGQMLGLSNDTLRRWDKSGTFPAVRTPTGQRRWRRADVEALLTERAAS